MKLVFENTLDESLLIPYEGIFWYIDDTLIVLKDQVDPNDQFFCTDLLHRTSWSEIAENYKVNGKCVSYDYFPRGRVEILPIKDEYLNVTYVAEVYMDKCIQKQHIKEEIENSFNLFLPNVTVSYPGQLYIDGSHYTCYNCR